MSAMEIGQIRNSQGYFEAKGRLADAVMGALGDQLSRRILKFATASARTVGEMSSCLGISLSTCYRRVSQLEQQGVLVVERITVADDRKFASYRSCFSSFRILSGADETSVEVVLNADVADKVRSRWISVAYSQAGGITA